MFIRFLIGLFVLSPCLLPGCQVGFEHTALDTQETNTDVTDSTEIQGDLPGDTDVPVDTDALEADSADSADLADNGVACGLGEQRCGGVCVDVLTSVSHCGACGNNCRGFSNVAEAGCLNAACQILACVDGYTDADNNANTGCERGLSTERVSSGLVALWTFEEGMGNAVTDQSGVDPPLDLTMSDSDGFAWLSERNGLETNNTEDETLLGDPVKLQTTFVASPAAGLTIEVWARPNDVAVVGPARLLTFSDNTSERNLTVGQLQDNVVFRLSTDSPETSANGGFTNPPGEMLEVPAFVAGETIHLVFTHDIASDTLLAYQDGAFTDQVMVPGGYGDWLDVSFGLFNEGSGLRAWDGALFLVAIYDRPLTSQEVLQNYQYGSVP